MTPATERISLTVNGRVRELEAPPARTLLDVLREDLYLTGAKLACDDGECGSCFVLLGKKPTKACLLATNRCQGKEITTIEGLTAPSLGGHDGGSARIGALHPLQEAFLEVGATQCGFCIPGMIM
jgi:carbon-monoxide dehydrogenase small subunit